MPAEKVPDLSGQRAWGEDVLRIWLLGVFRVAVGGRQVEDAAWRLRKARSLVKLLALKPGHRLHREQVIEVLWPDLDLATATNNLHQLLHFARRTLQPDLPVRQAPQYFRLQQDSVGLSASGEIWVDAVAFTHAAGEARRTRDPDAYRAALALYAGDLLPDDLYEDWARPRREELQEIHRGLLWELAELYRSGGELASAHAVLTDLVTHDPLHEEGHAALMQVYAAQGDARQAVQQYRRFEETLRHELGAEPAPGTLALFQEIQAGRLARPAATVAGPAVGAKPHEPAARRAARHTPKKPAGKRAGALPAPLTSFVGRDREIADLTRHLHAVRLLTLVGPGGSGKTRLALHLAGLAADEFEDGVWFVDLSAVTDPALVPGTVGTALGVREQARRSLLDTVTNHLRPKHLLLVLDNCEHLAEACASLSAHLMQNCSSLQILGTSRQSLRVPGELVWRVPPLSLPGDGDLALSGLLSHDAIRLFVERGRLARPGFELTRDNAPAVIEVCRRLDGLPLAIELAAARLRVLALPALRERLEDRFRLLAESGGTLPPRQRTLQGAMDWSYGLLSRVEQSLFGRLSVFQGGFTLDAAEIVCADDDLARDDVLDLLAHLIDKSMVVMDEIDDGSVRYRLLDTLLAYGRERLLTAGEAEVFQTAHARYFTDLAGQAAPELTGAAQSRWLDRLEGERDNLRSALQWWIRENDTGQALRLAIASVQFWFVRGYFSEGRSRLSEILRLDGLQPGTLDRARGLASTGKLAWAQGDLAEAKRLHEGALAICTRLDDKQGIAFSLNGLALVARAQGDPRQARRMYEEALAINRGLNDRAAIALNLQNIGILLVGQGEYAAARERFQEKLSIERELENTFGIALALHGLGSVATDQGDYATARTVHEESLALRRQMNDRTGIAASLQDLGVLAMLQGDLAEAHRLHEESLALAREVGNRTRIMSALADLGETALKAGDLATARSYLRESLEMSGELGAKDGLARTLEHLAILAVDDRHPERALRLAGAAAALREEQGIRLPPATATEHARALDQARMVLGPEASQAAWSGGRGLTLEQAVAYALAPTPERG